MKRSFFAAAILLFAVFFISHNYSYAQEKVLETDTPIGTDSISTESAATTTARVEYELPYPGMLPDHPLYFLKAIRDGVVKMLINDPMKKARFSLLSAEKRMYAGKMLVDKGKDGLAVTTISKGNNYIDEAFDAIDLVVKQNSQNTDIVPFLLQLRSALLKHQEVSRDIKPLLDRSFLEAFAVEQARIDGYLENVKNRLKE